MTDTLFEGFPVSNIGGYVCFQGSINIEKLREALYKTIDSMDSMSIRITFYNNEYYQYISEEKKKINIVYLNTGKGKKHAVEQLAKEMLESPFKILDQQLFNIIIFSDKSEYCGYILCLHHIIMDGWSVQLFAESVSKYYNDEEVKLGSYFNFVEKEQEYLISERAKKDKFYWKEFIKKNYKRTIAGDRICSGIREEYLLTGEFKSRFEQLSNIYKGGNIVLAGCFLLLDYYRGGTGIIDLPNYNRINRVFRKTGGMFTSTVLTAVEYDAKLTLESFISKLKIEMWKGYCHQKWPYDLLEIDSKTEPFRYSVNYYNTDLSQKLGDVKGDYHEVYPGVQTIPMQVILKTWGDVCTITFDMRKDYYLEGDGEAFFSFFKNYVNTLFEMPKMTVGDWIQKVKHESIQFQTQTINAKNIPGRYLEDLFVQAITEIDQNEIVVYNENNMVKRKELLHYIGGAARIFVKMGLCSGSRVTICLNNSLEYIVYVYAASFLGITFIPMDPGYPKDHIQYVFENSQSQYIVTDKDMGSLPCIKPILVDGDIVFPASVEENITAYIIYTSGTTGRPKGVMISRKALTAYLRWAVDVYGVETFFLYSSPSFDLSITSLFLPLVSKSRLVVIKKEKANLYQIASQAIADKITAIKGTPSGLSLLVKHKTERLRLKVIICGGEDLSTPLAKELQERFGSECRIFNEYGPTECTVGCMCYQYDGRVEGKAVSIGKSAPGTNVFILDNNLNLCITGKSGEIYLAGEQLATGYFDLPEENNRSFLYHEGLKRRLYKTGDIARYSQSGNVEYIGRVGRQQKIHGFRVELDGIERVLKAIPSVHNAAVWIHNGHLIAAVESASCTENLLTRELEKIFPSYCIPHMFLISEKLPYTINGKLDYQLLESSIKNNIEAEQKNVQDYNDDKRLDEKQRILEMVIRELFQFSNKIETFNYFLEGGDSITALRLIGMLEQKGFQISLADILDHPDYVEMVSYVSAINAQYKENDAKTTIELPEHLKYLLATCDNISKYRQVNVLKIYRKISKETVRDLYEYMVERFPVLGMEYHNGRIYLGKRKQIVGFEYSDKEIDDQRIISWIRHNESVEHLFCIDTLVSPEASYLKLNIHHMLIDGTSWYQLIMATADYFFSANEFNTRYLDYSLLENKMKYSWDPYEYFLGTDSSSPPKSYAQYSASIETEDSISEDDILDAIKNAIFSFEQYTDYVLLMDMNGRRFIPNSRQEGLGCYSLMIPVYNDAKDVGTQVHQIVQTGIIHIPNKNCIRINYMGKIEQIFRKTGFVGSIKYLNTCIIENLKECSAYGCDFEITAWISSHNKLNIYITSRTEIISLKDSEMIINSVQGEIDEFRKTSIFWNCKEELQILEEIEGDLY